MSGALSWSEGDALRRGAIGVVLGAGLGLAAFTWWPNGEYRPLQPSEKVTVVSGVRAIGAIPTGRPALTRQRQEQLGGAPTVRETGGDFRSVGTTPEQERRPADEPATTTTTTVPTTTTTVPATTTTVPAAPVPADPTTPTTTLPPTPPPTP